MRLNDTLRICLLSLASRYPVHTVDFDDNIIETPGIDTKGWIAQEIIEFLESYAPHLLQAPACLLVDECNCEIFLPMYSEHRSVIHIHCRGKIPASHRHLAETREMILSGVDRLRMLPAHSTFLPYRTA